MAWKITQIEIQETATEERESELSELWECMSAKSFSFPGCTADRSVLARLQMKGGLWRLSDGTSRVWFVALDKTQTKLECWDLKYIAFDCAEETAIEAVSEFVQSFPGPISTIVPTKIADCELFSFWLRVAESLKVGKIDCEAYSLLVWKGAA